MNQDGWNYNVSYWPSSDSEVGDTLQGILGPLETEVFKEGRREREVEYRLITPSPTGGDDGDSMPRKLAIGAALGSLRDVPPGSEIQITWAGKKMNRAGDNSYNHYRYRWRSPASS